MLGVHYQSILYQDWQVMDTSYIHMYLYVPDFRPRIRISRSGCRRFMRALRVLLTEYFIVQGDCLVSTQVCSVSAQGMLSNVQILLSERAQGMLSQHLGLALRVLRLRSVSA
jgi:hypothetical protein